MAVLVNSLGLLHTQADTTETSVPAFVDGTSFEPLLQRVAMRMGCMSSWKDESVL